MSEQIDGVFAEFKIDQHGRDKALVSGLVCGGLGIHKSHTCDDCWIISHLASGLRVLDCWSCSVEDARRFGSMLLSIGDWTSELEGEAGRIRRQEFYPQVLAIRELIEAEEIQKLLKGHQEEVGS